MQKYKLNRFLLGLFAVLTLCVGTVQADKTMVFYQEPLILQDGSEWTPPPGSSPGEIPPGAEIITAQYNVKVALSDNEKLPLVQRLSTSFGGRILEAALTPKGNLEMVVGQNTFPGGVTLDWGIEKIKDSAGRWTGKWKIEGVMKVGKIQVYSRPLKKYVQPTMRGLAGMTDASGTYTSPGWE